MQLSSSNTSEVIQKRLLVKTDAAKPALAKVWQEKGDILRNQLAFDPTTTASLRPYTSEEEFIDNYPFVPWHYQILQKVFESIRTKGAAGKQLAMGERSQLEAFQTAAQQISPQGLDSLVPFWRFYAAIESFLEPAVSRTITQACQNGILDEFDGNLLKTLFLIRYVDVLKSTLDNLVTLSIDKIDTDKVELRRRVEKSLNKLEREMLIARVEDKYVFLTNEEKEIENEIRNVEVDFSAINKKLASIIFDDILKNRKYRYPANKQDFDISRFLNGHPLDGAMLNDLVVKILTPKDPTYTFYNSDAACRPYTSEGDGCILIRLPEEGRTWTDIDLVVQTEKFLKDNAGQRPEQASLLSEKAKENSVREKMLRVQLESLIAEADVWAIGERLPKKSSTPSSIVDEACRYVIENTFAKLKTLRPFNGDIAREIHALLTVENDAELDLGELEFFDVNFSYIDNETLEEFFVSVPEQGGSELIPAGMPKPGVVHLVTQAESGMTGLYRFETQMTAGNGKHSVSGLGSSTSAKEAIRVGFDYFKGNLSRVSATAKFSEHEYHLHVVELHNTGPSTATSLAALIALCSVLLAKPVQEQMVVLGSMTLGGVINPVQDLAASLQLAFDSGAKKVLLPMSSAVDIPTVPAELFTKFQVSFYSEPVDAVYKALGVN